MFGSAHITRHLRCVHLNHGIETRIAANTMLHDFVSGVCSNDCCHCAVAPLGITPPDRSTASKRKPTSEIKTFDRARSWSLVRKYTQKKPFQKTPEKARNNFIITMSKSSETTLPLQDADFSHFLLIWQHAISAKTRQNVSGNQTTQRLSSSKPTRNRCIS